MLNRMWDPQQKLLPAKTFSSEVPMSSHGDIFPEQHMSGKMANTVHPTPFSFESADAAYPSDFSDMRHPVSSPTDVWQTIRNIDRNTRFNPDPEVEGVNEVRRDIRGGLRNNLEDAVPGLKPLSERYGDLRTADDALSLHSGQQGSAVE